MIGRGERSLRTVGTWGIFGTEIKSDLKSVCFENEIINRSQEQNKRQMKQFLKKYNATSIANNEKIDRATFVEKHRDYDFLYDLISQYGGYTFNNGLFRIHTFEYVDKWTALMTEYFEDEENPFDMICFAANWQGIMYCVDKTNSKITYLDPATCEWFSADHSLQLFFDEILVSGEYDIIFEDYFDRVVAYLKFEKLDYEDSLGHKIYLYLGGNDEVENYEVVNTEVLWELQVQLVDRINEIDEGGG